MVKIFYANSDATLYEAAPDINTGIDEILEVGKRLGTSGDELLKSRALVKFDITEIEAALEKYNANLNSCKFVLQMFTTDAKHLPAEYTIDANVVGQTWINGTGFESSNPNPADGVSWNLPLSGSNWISGSQDYNIPGTSLYVTGSGEGGSWLYQSGSALFNTSSFGSSYFYQPGLNHDEEFLYRPTDINMDVTDSIKLWISGSNNVDIENNGFILKFSDLDELDNNKQGYIRFFSRETHTIYVPRLLMFFDDSQYNETLEAVDLESYTMYTKLNAEYRDTDIVKVRIYGRDRYPRKSPTNLYPMQTIKRLPESTYYAIRDAYTDEFIIPYDNIYNKVSCDSTSNFIYIDMNNFMPERYYRVEFKIVDGFTEQRIDDEYYFKVTR
jgi:hypothetical protein